jgi:hypothetical protein
MPLLEQQRQQALDFRVDLDLLGLLQQELLPFAVSRPVCQLW